MKQKNDINRKNMGMEKVKKVKEPKLSNVAKKESWALTVLALPGIICLLVFNYIPMFGVIIAFKEYKPLKGVFRDAVRTIRNILGYSMLFLVVGTMINPYRKERRYKRVSDSRTKRTNYARRITLAGCGGAQEPVSDAGTEQEAAAASEQESAAATTEEGSEQEEPAAEEKGKIARPNTLLLWLNFYCKMVHRDISLKNLMIL